MLEGYLLFGLYGAAFSHAKSHLDNIKDGTLSSLGSMLRERGRPYESLQMLNFLWERGNTDFSAGDYKNYFPKVFSQLIGVYGKEYKIDETLFYALIRKESAFNAVIASRAGAVGLAQLMPETGDWIAEELELAKPDLTHPATSIRVRAYYLSFLEK